MPKNILVITGSPRKNGNSDTLAEAFISGANESGNKVLKFEAAFKNIGGCKACNACWSRGAPCVFADDFAELSELLEAADVLVFCTPVYWFGMSAQMKLAIDKFYAYVRLACPRKLKVKESVLLACAGDGDEKVFDGAIGTYKGITNYLKWKDRGIIAVPAVHELSDIANNPALEKAHELGRNI